MYLRLNPYCCCIFQVIIIGIVILSVSSCAVFHAPINKPAAQPAIILLQDINEQRITTAKQLIALLNAKSTKNKLPKHTQKALKAHPVIAVNLLNVMSRGENVQQSIIDVIELQKTLQSEYIYVALSLYPIDGYRLAEKLALSNNIDNDTITSASLKAGFDPALIFPATAANNEEFRIVPLMESASITLYNQTANSSAAIWFKAQSDSQWQEGLALQWEPIQGALSGSIVYLEPNKTYVIKVALSENSELISEDEYTFTTRAESPPIDPDKIYYLSDIYQGGQLDLEALGIEGSESGWAKIIGDGVTVEANEGELSAIHLGSQNYIMLENITTKGGERYGIHGYKGHHTWIKGCDISNYGRIPGDFRNGKAYPSAESTTPINYDSGIYLERSGVVVIENCEIHTPNGKANSWQYGHPHGPNAFQIWGKHDTEAYRGQYIVRNNRFYGTPDKRFNDVIEGRLNFDRSGAFVRDSAIYNNYLAYANDDLIEIDGGQANVLVYNNEMTQGYCGISTAPNMIGPSYVFHNYIHDLGDERGKEWAAIKMGGIMSKPAGLTNVFENLVVTNRNGITASRVNNDNTLWVNAKNNIMIMRNYANQVGYSIYDTQKYGESVFSNNLLYNLKAQRPIYDLNETDDFLNPDSYNSELIADILNAGSSATILITAEAEIPNFSNISPSNLNNKLTQPALAKVIDFTGLTVSSFDNQDEQNSYVITDNNLGITLRGNTWKTINFDYSVTPETIVEFDLIRTGKAEIIGMAFENDNKLTNKRLIKFFGSQVWEFNGPTSTLNNEQERLSLKIGQYITGEINRVVFVLDNDVPIENYTPEATFQNINIYDKVHERFKDTSKKIFINVGLHYE